MNLPNGYPRYRWLVLLTACLGTAAFQIGMISYAPLLGHIARDLEVDVGTATNLMSVFVFTGSVAFIVGGFLCDRFGVLPVIALGLLSASGPAALLPWIGTHYGTVFWVRLIQGTSAGFVVCTMSSIMATWFPPEQKGVVGGFMGGSVALGSAVGVLTAPALLGLVGSWQKTAAWLSVPGWFALVVAAGLVLTLKRQGLSGRPKIGEALPGDGKGFRRGISAWITWVGVLVTFFAAWCLQTLYNLGPAYFAADKPIGVGFGPILSGKLMLALMLSGIAAPIVGGMLQDKVFGGNAKPVVSIGFVLSAVFTYAILSPSVYVSRPVLVASLILAGSGVTFLYPAIAAFVSVAYPVQIVGTMLGLWLGLGGFGGAVGVFVGGRILSVYGTYSAALLPVALAAIVGLILSLFLRRPGIAVQQT